MKIIVAGSRTFTDYNFLKEKLDKIFKYLSEIEIVSGGARGVDKLGEQYASKNGLKCTLFAADWTKNGKAAGYIRNTEMALYGDALVAFWDGKSKGTKHMIDIAEKKELQVRIIKI